MPKTLNSHRQGGHLLKNSRSTESQCSFLLGKVRQDKALTLNTQRMILYNVVVELCTRKKIPALVDASFE